jgi:hypothetical protein
MFIVSASITDFSFAQCSYTANVVGKYVDIVRINPFSLKHVLQKFLLGFLKPTYYLLYSYHPIIGVFMLRQGINCSILIYTVCIYLFVILVGTR